MIPKMRRLIASLLVICIGLPLPSQAWGTETAGGSALPIVTSAYAAGANASIAATTTSNPLIGRQ